MQKGRVFEKLRTVLMSIWNTPAFFLSECLMFQEKNRRVLRNALNYFGKAWIKTCLCSESEPLSHSQGSVHKGYDVRVIHPPVPAPPTRARNNPTATTPQHRMRGRKTATAARAVPVR